MTLPSKPSHIHNVFHVSMLRKYELDPLHVVNYDEIEVNEDSFYVEESIQIVDRDVHWLWTRDILVVKVV